MFTYLELSLLPHLVATTSRQLVAAVCTSLSFSSGGVPRKGGAEHQVIRNVIVSLKSSLNRMGTCTGYITITQYTLVDTQPRAAFKLTRQNLAKSRMLRKGFWSQTRRGGCLTSLLALLVLVFVFVFVLLRVVSDLIQRQMEDHLAVSIVLVDRDPSLAAENPNSNTEQPF